MNSKSGDERLDELIGMVEEATTGGDFTPSSDDLGDIYQILLFAKKCLLESRQRAQDLKDIFGPEGM
jgi:hypothetical protein